MHTQAHSTWGEIVHHKIMEYAKYIYVRFSLACRYRALPKRRKKPNRVLKSSCVRFIHERFAADDDDNDDDDDNYGNKIRN